MPNSQNMFDLKAAAMVPMVLDLWVNNKFTWKCWHFYFSHFSNRPTIHVRAKYWKTKKHLWHLHRVHRVFVHIAGLLFPIRVKQLLWRFSYQHQAPAVLKFDDVGTLQAFGHLIDWPFGFPESEEYCYLLLFQYRPHGLRGLICSFWQFEFH